MSITFQQPLHNTMDNIYQHSHAIDTPNTSNTENTTDSSNTNPSNSPTKKHNQFQSSKRWQQQQAYIPNQGYRQYYSPQLHQAHMIPTAMPMQSNNSGIQAPPNTSHAHLNGASAHHLQMNDPSQFYQPQNDFFYQQQQQHQQNGNSKLSNSANNNADSSNAPNSSNAPAAPPIQQQSRSTQFQSSPRYQAAILAAAGHHPHQLPPGVYPQHQLQSQQNNGFMAGPPPPPPQTSAAGLTPQLNIAPGSAPGQLQPQLSQGHQHAPPGGSGVPSRTVYLGNIPSDISYNELLNHVRSGTVESLKLLPSKNCAFISFLDENSAMLFHSDAILKRLTINNHDIKIGWGKPTPVHPVVASCVARYNATRNVYLGNLNEDVTEEQLVQDLEEYGPIDTIKILSEKKIAFVHFTSILAAIRCVQSLPLVDNYKDRKVFYGKDRCAFITKTQQHNAAQYLGLNPNSENLLNQVDRDLIANALVQQSNAAAVIATSAGGSSNLGNRTIYLGNLHPDSTIEEICNVVRGGILQNIRLINERHVCFITFIDPISAAQFYAMSSLHGLIIHNRKIKVGWGKHSGSLPNSINLAVGNGASRNIYIGGLDKIYEIEFSKDKLYDDFKEFGEIEQINFFEERHCCFVNFTNISNAIKAIDGIRSNDDYHKCKINFGKDRCGNTPRQFQLQQGGGHHGHQNGGRRGVVNDVDEQQFYDYSDDQDDQDDNESESGVFEPYPDSNPMGIMISGAHPPSGSIGGHSATGSIGSAVSGGHGVGNGLGLTEANGTA